MKKELGLCCSVVPLNGRIIVWSFLFQQLLHFNVSIFIYLFVFFVVFAYTKVGCQTFLSFFERLFLGGFSFMVLAIKTNCFSTHLFSITSMVFPHLKKHCVVAICMRHLGEVR